jgi:hypothetical protein
MFLRIALISCLPAALFLGACNDSTGPMTPGSASDAKTLLLAAKWMPAARTINPGFDINEDGTIVTNLFAEEDVCEHDDVMTFKADGTFSTDEGPDKCDDSDPQIGTGTWVLNAVGDSLTMKDDSAPKGVPTKIVALNSSTLSLAATGDDWPDRKSRTETFTWKAK